MSPGGVWVKRGNRRVTPATAAAFPVWPGGFSLRVAAGYISVVVSDKQLRQHVRRHELQIALTAR